MDSGYTNVVYSKKLDKLRKRLNKSKKNPSKNIWGIFKFQRNPSTASVIATRLRSKRISHYISLPLSLLCLLYFDGNGESDALRLGNAGTDRTLQIVGEICI